MYRKGSVKPIFVSHRTTVHLSKEDTPFEKHYRREPQT